MNSHVFWRIRMTIFCFVALLVINVSPCLADQFTKRDFQVAIEEMRQGNSVTGQGKAYEAIKKIIQHGDKTLPWLMELLGDFRKMQTGIEIPNRSGDFPENSPGSDEEFREAYPQTVSDAARVILSDLTLFHDGYSWDIKPKERPKAIQKWRHWYKTYKNHLKWLPDKHRYIWKRKKHKT